MTEPDHFERFEAEQRAARDQESGRGRPSNRHVAIRALTVVAAVAVVLVVLQKGGVLGRSSPEVESYTCADLASDAVRISGERRNALAPRLLEVRSPAMTEDHRTDYTVPAGSRSADAVVLDCRGTGVYASGETAPVVIRLTVDSHSEAFVYLERVG